MKHRTRSILRIVPLALATMLPGIQTAAAAEETSTAVREDNWDVLYLGNQRIGYARSMTSDVTENGRKITRTTTETKMTIKRFGQSLQFETLLIADETPDGNLLGFTQELRNPPASTTRTVGRIDGNQLTLETTVAGRTQKRTIDWNPEIKGSGFQEQMLQELATRAGEQRRFKTFLPELNQVTDVRVVADNYQQVKLLDGKSHQLMKMTITQSALPTMPIRAFVDREGEALRTETDFLGMTLITYRVDREEALQAIAGGELDLAVSTLVRVGIIRRAHQTTRAVYRIKTPGRDPSGHVMADDSQQVRQLDPETIELTVSAVAVPDRAPVPRRETASEYLAATRFLQIDDPRVREHATRAAAGDIDPVKVAMRMERYVHEKLSKKNFSTALASAAEVAKNLEGDCTEHAVLLAALLRAKKIPSRVVVGLVYVTSGQSFGGHMWTEAFLNGRWVPLDATLGQNGVGAAHIKMAESSLADDAPAPISAFLPLLDVLGKMEIEVISTQ